MNENEIQQILDYQVQVIKKNRELQKYFRKSSPFSKEGGFLFSSHQKIYNALGGQIGMAKAIIKLLNQRTFEFGGEYYEQASYQKTS